MIRPAPLQLNGEMRNRAFTPHESYQRNAFLRQKLKTISLNLKIGFIDTTESLRKAALNNLLHGPRDPIHFNRKGYEVFAEILIHHLNKNS